jgi:3,4-dihydroxy 2-butanone 4-phosphate synthase/GTP cyclohydrolase II
VPSPELARLRHGFLSSPEEIIDEARNGRMFILVDDEDRENEGDLIIPAQMATPDAINFMAKYGRGLICLAMTKERVDTLGLELMSRANGTRHETAFTVSIEARDGVTTGISAADRARTISVAIDASKGRRTSSPPAMSSRWSRATAACWCAPAIPRRRSTSRGSPGSIPRA